jgi:Tol biopolymer transport system component
MTEPREPDRLIRAALEDGPSVLPDRVLDSVLGEVHRTRQRAALGPWRIQPMSRTALAATAVIAVVLIGGLVLFGRGQSAPVVGTVATASPSASQSPSVPPPSPSPIASASMPIGVQAPGTIVFGRLDSGTDKSTLLAVSPDGQRQTPLTPSDGCCLTMSPDGKSFAYAKDLGGRLAPGVASLDRSLTEWPWVWPDAGVGTIDSTRLNLAPGAVSSSGNVAFEGWDDQQPGRTGVYVSLDNGGGAVIGELKRLTTNPGTLHDIPIGFSPNGSRLLFIRDGDPGDGISGDLYVIATDGSGLHKLNPSSTTVSVSDAFGPGASWSPDGTQVTFSGFDATKTDGTSSVYVVDAAGGSAKAIAGPGSWSTSARWSPDGAWIAFDFADPPVSHDVYLIHPDGSGVKDITTSFDVGVCCSQWSPDGRWLVVQGSLTGRDDQSDLFIVSTVDGTYARLTQEPGGYRQWVDWVDAPVPTSAAPSP